MAFQYIIQTVSPWLSIPCFPDPVDEIPKNVVFAARGPSTRPGFYYNLRGDLRVADELRNNGKGYGYSGYENGRLVASGGLILWDPIDGEMIIHGGGSIGIGWYTHIPPQFVWPPQDAINRYKEVKEAARRDFIESDFEEGDDYRKVYTCTRDIDHKQACGERIFITAPRDPFVHFDLGGTASRLPFCIGDTFGVYHFPTMLWGLDLIHTLPGEAKGMERFIGRRRRSSGLP